MQGIEETAESKIKEVEHRGKDIFGNAKERFFEKKSDVVDVHKGDTLWGISRKYGVSFLVGFSLLSIWSHCICMLEILLWDKVMFGISLILLSTEKWLLKSCVVF